MDEILFKSLIKVSNVYDIVWTRAPDGVAKAISAPGIFIWFKCCNIHPRTPGELEKSFTAWG